MSLSTHGTAYFTDFADQSESTGEGGSELTGHEEIVIPESLSDISDSDLTNLHSAAVQGFSALYGEDGSGLTDEALQALSILTSGIERVQKEIDARKEKQSEREEQATELAARIGVAKTTAPATEPPPVQPEQSYSDKSIRINLGALSRSKPVPSEPAAAPVEARTMKSIVKAAADVSGYAAGQGMDWSDIGKAVDRRLSAFNQTQFSQAAAAGQHIRTQMGVFSITKPFEEGLIARSNDIAHIDELLQRASNEKRLPKGSLVASGGWCAPSETIYDLCEIETRDGLYSLPEIAITRGGIKYTPGPKFSDFYANSGFYGTEADDIAGNYDGSADSDKPCYTVPCPTFLEERLDFGGVCINAGLLQSRGYPEIIARTVRGVLVAHDFRMAQKALEKVVAGSTAVAMTTDQVGTTAPVLDAIEMQAEHVRALTRIGRGTSLEAVFPFWVRGAIRSDLARRGGVDLLGVTDAQIDDWFALRGVAAQYVYGLQDPSGALGTFKTWPATAKFLMYPAGSWVKGTSDIITLDTLYDSVQLGQNNYTALFSEEGQLVVNTCHESLAVTVPICSTGEVGAGIDMACDGTAAVVAAP